MPAPSPGPDDHDEPHALLLPGFGGDLVSGQDEPHSEVADLELDLDLTEPENRLGAFLHRLENPAHPLPALHLAGALLARRLASGYTHLSLAQALEEHPALAGTTGDARQWAGTLGALHINSPAAQAAQRPAPLVLDSLGRLYLYKYWSHERQAAHEFIQRSNRRRLFPELNPSALVEAFAEQFPDDPGTKTDPLPALGAVLALTRGFSLISGGPGTGKTTLVIRLLRVLEAAAPDLLKRTIVAAPTGKAARRLQESFGQHAPPGIEPVTLHRLLQADRHGQFRRDALRPLTARLVIIDEASMIDLLLLNNLLCALPEDAHLVLVGDENQLTAVDAGAVFPELTAHSRAGEIDDALSEDYHRLTGTAWPGDRLPRNSAGDERPVCGIRLTTVHRFAGEGAIQQLARHVVAGETPEAWHLLQNARDLPDLAYAPLPAEGIPVETLSNILEEEYAPLLEMTDPVAMLAHLQGFRILTALRRGREGSQYLNDLIESRLRRRSAQSAEGPWYPGRAIMITRNDYQLGLSNGDTGIVAYDDRGRLRVFFPQREEASLPASPADSPANPRAIPPARLPSHEPAWVLTIHKSQGSEFSRVLLLLAARENPLLSRELVYTGITRARERVELWTTQPIFTDALSRRESQNRTTVFAAG